MNRPIKFGSVCSGIEAASVAWHPLDWRADWLAEVESFPSAVLAHHYPDVPNLGDMTTIARRVIAEEVSAPDVLCGCEPCLGSGKAHSYVVCVEHDRCVTCKCTRAQLTETPWGTRDGGWRCKPCQGALDAKRKAEALEAAAAKGHSEDDCCYVDNIICPHCATEQSRDDRNESDDGLECDTCGGLFDLEVDWSPRYTTKKAKPKAAPPA